jgi:hypothetical protein
MDTILSLTPQTRQAALVGGLPIVSTSPSRPPGGNAAEGQTRTDESANCADYADRHQQPADTRGADTPNLWHHKPHLMSRDEDSRRQSDNAAGYACCGKDSGADMSLVAPWHVAEYDRAEISTMTNFFVPCREALNLG